MRKHRLTDKQIERLWGLIQSRLRIAKWLEKVTLCPKCGGELIALMQDLRDGWIGDEQPRA